MQGPNPPPGGRDDGDSSQGDEGDGDGNEARNEDADEDDESSKDSEMEDADSVPVKDPKNVETAKYYKPQTSKGKALTKMFCQFFDLPARDTNAIVVYFGIYNIKRLVAFQQDYWKDTFVQWQKWHPNQDGPERAMVLSLPQQEPLRQAQLAPYAL